MAAVPSIGRASQVEGVRTAPEADATHALYERYSSQIFGYCMHQLGSREEAEDAVQSTFLNAFRGLSRGVVPEMEQAWLFKIAHNVCLSRRRSSWRRGRIESPEDFQEMQDTLAAPSKRDLRDELVGLQDVLEEMPENQRRAILLREWQGLSYREIAVEMELSQSAVETLIFRARRTLANGLQEPPKKTWRKGARRGVDLGGALAFAKTFFTGGAAVKVGAAVVAVTAATVAATTPPSVHHRLQPAPRAEAAAPAVAPTRAPTLTVEPARAPMQARGAAAKTKVAPLAASHSNSAPTHVTVASDSVAETQASAPAPAAVVEQPTAPAQAHNDEGKGGNDNASDHGNGNAKHDGAAAPAATAPAPSARNRGQAKKDSRHAGDPRVPAVATGAAAPETSADAAPMSDAAAQSAAPAAPGNGHGGESNAGGNGNGRGKK